MATSRRIGAESSETRAALLDAAERLMLERGLRGGDLAARRQRGRA